MTKKASYEVSIPLAAKLASVIVHAEEFLETGHLLDKAALEGALQEKDVQKWIKHLGPLAPEKRG